MGSPHPKARPAASQEGSGNLHDLFKKAGFSWRFKRARKAFGTIVAGNLDHLFRRHRAEDGSRHGSITGSKPQSLQ
jgi:hypothetical protein